MAVIRDESLSRSIMLLCLGAATLILATQGRSALSRAERSPEPAHRPTPVIPPPTRIAPPLKPAVADRRLVVDLSDRRVYLYQNQQVQASFPVAVGQPGWETPLGTFHIIQMQHDPVWKHPITGAVVPAGPNNPLGSRWIGFWSDGKSLIGFHGTNEETLVGQAVSHGCLRMRNQDIMALYDQVGLETQVTVKP